MGEGMKKRPGSVGNLLETAVCILAMTAVMAFYMDCVSLIKQKSQVNQLARKYILQMEAAGGLTDAHRTALFQELEAAGASEIDLTGTTSGQVPYSTPVVLVIRGKLRGEYAFEERRVSTSKN